MKLASFFFILLILAGCKRTPEEPEAKIPSSDPPVRRVTDPAAGSSQRQRKSPPSDSPTRRPKDGSMESSRPQGNDPPGNPNVRADQKISLADARRDFKTKLVRKVSDKERAPDPPAKLFSKVSYDSPVGKLAAYVSKPPQDGKRRPAIIWITGGDCNSIGEVWENAPQDNDQTASAFWKAGTVTMYPSLRGGNDNPGFKESFFGEVDDVLAAADYLARQDFVDPKRIYLGGHSTGGTLVMLVAASSDRFRAVFSFGPADDVRGYGGEYLFFDASNPKEFELRNPGRWLHSIKSPTFVFEGTDQGNLNSLIKMKRLSQNPMLQFYPVKGNHFSILFPVTGLIASKILRDDGQTCNLAFTDDELGKLGIKK